MPTLLPTVKSWIADTDWKLQSLTYDYDANVVSVTTVSGPLEMLEGVEHETVRIEMLAAGMHETGPKIPMSCPISNGYSGQQTLIVDNVELEFEAAMWDGHPMTGGRISVQNGTTTFRVKGTLVT